MEQVQVTITLNADDIAFLESWQLLNPRPPHDHVTIEQKLQELVFEKRLSMEAAALDDDMPF